MLLLAEVLVLLLLLVQQTAATDTGGRLSDTVIFDIDGTITYNPYGSLLVRRKSREAMQLWMDLGYEVVIVTARSQSLEWYTRTFLTLWGFPLDKVLAMRFAPQKLRTDQEKIDFKKSTIRDLSISLELNIMYAYGDSTTDFAAYAGSGIHVSRVFAFKRTFAADCLEGDYAECLEDYTDHLAYIEDQPFLL